jgi:hypothetical protein
MGVIPIRGAKDAPKAERSKMETLQLTPDILNTWILPPFQAPLKLNAKLLQIADELAEQNGTPAISGILTLGILPNDTSLYLLDGQHRRAAAIESGKKEFLADVRVRAFDTMEEMAQEYLKLNTPISRKSPDDQLRALQESSKPLQMITKECPYIGYRYIRANPDSPVVGMAAVLRRWRGAGFETPSTTGAAGGAAELALHLTIEDAEQIIQFMQVAFTAWKKDIENSRLWSALNMTMCMWMWRNLVLDRDRSGSRRYVVLTTDQFRRCLMAVSADTDYVDWLGGRNMSERDRAPCYRRLRGIFTSRLQSETNDRFKMPSPGWMTN